MIARLPFKVGLHVRRTRRAEILGVRWVAGRVGSWCVCRTLGVGSPGVGVPAGDRWRSGSIEVWPASLNWRSACLSPLSICEASRNEHPWSSGSFPTRSRSPPARLPGTGSTVASLRGGRGITELVRWHQTFPRRSLGGRSARGVDRHCAQLHAVLCDLISGARRSEYPFTLQRRCCARSKPSHRRNAPTRRSLRTLCANYAPPMHA